MPGARISLRRTHKYEDGILLQGVKLEALVN